MTILEILEAHRTLANSPADTVCACDRTWRLHTEYRAHLAEVLDKHMREAKAEAWAEGHAAGQGAVKAKDNPYKESK